MEAMDIIYSDCVLLRVRINKDDATDHRGCKEVQWAKQGIKMFKINFQDHNILKRSLSMYLQPL